jgi:hypothetical protein
MGQKEGIWICTFADLPSLSAVLRDSLIAIHRVLAGQENRGDKMSMVYDFVTSDAFRLQVEAIVEGFTQMQTDLETEKRAMARIWKQREKQIEKVLLNTSNMYGSIRGGQLSMLDYSLISIPCICIVSVWAPYRQHTERFASVSRLCKSLPSKRWSNINIQMSAKLQSSLRAYPPFSQQRLVSGTQLQTLLPPQLVEHTSKVLRRRAGSQSK